jgi:ribosomal protein S14
MQVVLAKSLRCSTFLIFHPHARNMTTPPVGGRRADTCLRRANDSPEQPRITAVLFNKPSASDAQAIPVRRYPTRLHVRCPQCARQGIAECFLDTPPKLRCTKCGNRDPIITSRDSTRTWKRRAGR